MTAGTPPQIITRLDAEVVRITRLPETRGRLTAAGFLLVGSSPLGKYPRRA
ncbi:MAG: hypothetical protein ACT4PQ_06640 [Betaproteobacteria bacterium]